jgi:hypothetical protein
MATSPVVQARSANRGDDRLCAYGGGCPTPVRITLTPGVSAELRAEVQKLSADNAQVYLLAETSDWIVLGPSPHLDFVRGVKRSVHIRRSDVKRSSFNHKSRRIAPAFTASLSQHPVRRQHGARRCDPDGAASCFVVPTTPSATPAGRTHARTNGAVAIHFRTLRYVNVLSVSEHDVLNLGGRGGEPFVDLVNRLLRAEATMAGKPASAVISMSVNERDGGVDARLDLSRPSPFGWFPTPTCWQIKSGPLPPRKAVAEINKPYVRELLTRGYTYRLAVRDDLTARKRENLENALSIAARKIAPQTKAPCVLDANDLATWCSRYPALVIAIFKPHLGNVMHFETWRDVARASGSDFVPDDRFERVKAAIEQHTRFADTPAGAVMTLGGPIGSGRTRLIFEAVAAAGLESIVLYADSEAQVDALTTSLANETSTQAVLVAGECGAVLREKIRVRLSGSRQRVRAIAVASPGTPRDRCDIWIDRPAHETVKQIIDRNFKEIDETTRGAFVDLGSPYLSVIIDLLGRHGGIGNDGDLTRVINPLSAILDGILTSDERSVLAAASLVERLDIRPDSPAQLSAIAAITGQTEEHLRSVLGSLFERDVFTGDVDQLIHVQPPAVASVLFRDAWLRWADEIDADRSMSIASLSRAARCHDPDVRADIALRHEDWAYGLTIASLADSEMVRRFLLLIEIDPARYLPVLIRLSENASLDEVQCIKTRSDIVHFCDKFAAFEGSFDAIERVLFRLATRETQTFSNNSTFYWTGLFALALSSTTAPFDQRLNRLETRIVQAETSEQLDLAFKGLSVIFSNDYWRIEPEQYVGGRLRPVEKMPDGSEFIRNRWAAFALLQRLVTGNDDGLRARAVALVLEKVWFFLNEGLLPELRAILAPSILTEAEFQKTLSTVREFVHVYGDRTEAPPYLDEVRRWIAELLPDTPEKRVWAYFTRDEDEELQDDAREIAPDLLRDDIDFAKVQRIVDRGNAYRAILLGAALGTIDAQTTRLLEIVAAAKPAQGFSFYRGYVGSLLENHLRHSDVVNRLLDELESSAPEVCAEIALGGWRSTKALERLTRLLEEDRIDPSRARDLSSAGERALSGAEFAAVIDLLRSKVDMFPSAADTGLDMIWRRLHSNANTEAIELEAFTRFVDAVTLDDDVRDRRHWGLVIKELAKRDATTAIVLSAKGLGSRNDLIQFHAQETLAKLSEHRPVAVANAVGRALLTREGIGWHFLRLSALYRALPVEAVKEWLDQAGVEGARALARHLPWPKLEGDVPVVHPLTEYVLLSFEDDEEVFTAFSRAFVVRSYRGDIAEEHEKEAERRRPFVNHPLRRIREWARNEVAMAKQSAKHWRQRKRTPRRR